MESQLIKGLTIMSLVILLLAFLLRKFKQPYFVSYILAGVLLGPDLLDVFHDSAYIKELGELGVVLLMFFVGAEIHLPDLARNLARPALAVICQVGFSFAFIYLLSLHFHWELALIILLACVVSLSSSAIIFQYLSKSGQMRSTIGTMACGVLILQDILVVPMMLGLNIIANDKLTMPALARTAIGAALCVIFLWAAVSKRLIRIPFKDELTADHDMQVFVGFVLCFGMGWCTWYFGLSPALGAFMAGIIVSQDKATLWLDHALVPFRVFFLAFFFISVGLQIDIGFVKENMLAIAALTLCVLVINSVINTVIFRITGHSLKDSVYAGALLSQIGEFSFVLMTLAKSLGLVSQATHQIILAVIAMTMVVSMLWIKFIERFLFKMIKGSTAATDAAITGNG